MRYLQTPFWQAELFGLNSVQGILEMGGWYAEGHVILHFDPAANPGARQIVETLEQLQQEGYIKAELTPMPNEPTVMRLQKIALTVKGHEHLRTLRDRSTGSRFRTRATEIAWIIVASILTTLATLQVKGCIGAGP
jgi:DNA-binding PadR family transcriptional regulator